MEFGGIMEQKIDINKEYKKFQILVNDLSVIYKDESYRNG